MELTLAVPSLMDIIDLGVHQVANGFDSVRICEARLLELGPPNFPKLLTSKVRRRRKAKDAALNAIQRIGWRVC